MINRFVCLCAGSLELNTLLMPRTSGGRVDARSGRSGCRAQLVGGISQCANPGGAQTDGQADEHLMSEMTEMRVRSPPWPAEPAAVGVLISGRLWLMEWPGEAVIERPDECVAAQSIGLGSIVGSRATAGRSS